jgi:hypothetical protein
VLAAWHSTFRREAFVPQVEVYAVNFANGNLDAYLDPNGWGSMQYGSSALDPNDVLERRGDSRGLYLSLTRAPGFTTRLASLGAYVVPPQGALFLASRLLLRLEFDRPYASRISEQAQPEPWAIALNVKRARSPDESLAEPFAAVTCQFNRNTAGRDGSGGWDGVRLNTPNAEQGDQAPALDGGPDYDRYVRRFGIRGYSFRWATQFALEHSFCGVGRVAGFGTLTIGTKRDTRAYSSTALAPASPTAVGSRPTLGALGVSLATTRGVGTMSVRLRRFSVSVWPPVDGAQQPGPEAEL